MYSNRRSSTPQGGRGAAQAWGSGFRSDQHDNRQGGGSGRRVEFGSATNQGNSNRGGGRQQQQQQQQQNRFATLYDGYSGNRGGGGSTSGRGQQSQGGRRQENRQGGRGEPAADWRTLVRHDWQNERPMWPLTCYGHQRDQPNDIEGETSPEEVRWAQMEAARSGQSVQQLQGEFQAAVQAKDDQFQVLLRASRPPSLGGPPIPPTPALGSAPVFGASAPPSLGFGQFGSQAAPPGPAFGTPAPAFMTGGGAFGGGNVRPSFGGGAAPSFGSAAPFGQAGFGTPATPGFGTLGSPATPVQPQQQLQATAGNFGSPAAQPHSQSAPSFGTPSYRTSAGAWGDAGFGRARGAFGDSPGSISQSVTFGAQPGSTPLAAATASPATPQAVPTSSSAVTSTSSTEAGDAALWTGQFFERRKVPEMPPPQMYCIG